MLSVQTRGLKDVYKMLGIFEKGEENSLVNMGTDFHELYPTLGGKKIVPWLQKSNTLDLQCPRT